MAPHGGGGGGGTGTVSNRLFALFRNDTNFPGAVPGGNRCPRERSENRPGARLHWTGPAQRQVE